MVRGIPRPLGNVLGGGKHAIGGTDIQEFLVFSEGGTVQASIFANANVHKLVGKLLKKQLPGTAIGKGDEGAWVANIENESALKLVAEACNTVADEVKFKVRLGIDMAASELYRRKKYHYRDKVLSPPQQIKFVENLIDTYNLHIVEDPLEQNDFDGYAELTERVGDRCIIMGDDLFVTTKARLEHGIKMGACNAILIKPNQVGTLTDTYETVQVAHSKGYKTIISHRSGETTDDTIAHLGVAFGCYGIKTGVVGGERAAKLNELIRIEEDIYPQIK
jgi:enolase